MTRASTVSALLLAVAAPSAAAWRTGGARHLAVTTARLRRSPPPLAQLRSNFPDEFEDEEFLELLEEDLQRASRGLRPRRRPLGRKLGAADDPQLGALDDDDDFDGGENDDDDAAAIGALRGAAEDADDEEAAMAAARRRARRRLPAAIQRPLAISTRAFAELRDSYDLYSQKPSQQLLLGTLALLLGFYFAQGLTPGIVGQGGYWEYVAGGMSIFVVERVTTEYYSRPMHMRSPTLKLVQAFKVGFIFGCTLDALKLAG